jgi:PAS domain S-box-containing protein
MDGDFLSALAHPAARLDSAGKVAETNALWADGRCGYATGTEVGGDYAEACARHGGRFGAEIARAVRDVVGRNRAEAEAEGIVGTSRLRTFVKRLGDGALVSVLPCPDEGEELARARAANEELRSAVNEAPIVLFATDPSGFFTLSEGQALSLLGLRPGQVVGMQLRELYEDSPIVVEFFERALEGERVRFEAEVDSVPFDVVYRPLRDASGTLKGVVGFGFDLTERKRLERQLFQSQKLESIGRLAGGVAHDFNNLLTAIMNYASLLEASLTAPSQREDVAQILAAGRRATELTRQLLTFARQEIVEPRVIDVAESVQQTTRLLRRMLGEHIELVERIASDPPRVRIDPSQFEQVLFNLAVNARDAMPEGGTLTIDVSSVVLGAEAGGELGIGPGNYLRLAVTDTGVGMSDEVRSRVFEPFFTTKAFGKGTGLGLATSYGIVRQARGAISVRSEPGRGATFEVHLPAVAAAVEPRFPEKEPDPARGSETILVVEDDPAVLSIVGRTLRANGYTVLVASSGADALAIYREHEGAMDLLLTDVVMPRMSGKQVAEALPGLPVLYMSGYAEPAIAVQGELEAGAVLLRKPFTPAELLGKVRDVLGRHRARARTS